ncbi:MAG: AAA family ATPase [Pseudomonadota bacterium]
MSDTNSTVVNPATNSTLASILKVQTYLQTKIIGQPKLILRLLIAALSDGHLLVEGAPGLAKTKAIKELAECVEGNFQRIQFTPDLLPADLTGTDIYRSQTGSFEFQPGPIFHSLILADEINRAPAKVQSALLEAMAERQVTIGQNTYSLPKLFLVMATQNPIEQEGTYPLPEAQLDRFLMYVCVNYPQAAHEQEILKLARLEANEELLVQQPSRPVISQAIIFNARQQVLNVHLSEPLEKYIVELVMVTRQPEKYGDDLASWIQYGASPRATIALDRTAKSCAWLKGRDYVMPEDIHEVVLDVLRHRIILSFSAQSQAITSEHVMNEILSRVVVP